MSGRQSAATDKALKLHAKGATIAQAARKAGVSWVTLYRALGGKEGTKSRRKANP